MIVDFVVKRYEPTTVKIRHGLTAQTPGFNKAAMPLGKPVGHGKPISPPRPVRGDVTIRPVKIVFSTGSPESPFSLCAAIDVFFSHQIIANHLSRFSA
jgi:hypothetical protein